MKNYYRILGIHIDAEYEEIRAAYRILAQQHHPDKGGSQREFTLIQEAYTILSDPKTKRAYDQDLLDLLAKHQLVVSSRKEPSVASWLWLGFAGIFATGALLFAYWAYQQHQKHESLAVVSLKPASIIKLATSATVRKAAPTPLKHKLVAAANRKKNNSQAVNAQLDQLGSYSGNFYLLNVGSFTSLPAAKERQTQLSALGFSGKIQKINANSEGDASYNVFIGPFYNLENANKILDTLGQKNIEANLEQVSNE